MQPGKLEAPGLRVGALQARGGRRASERDAGRTDDTLGGGVAGQRLQF
jgi:hypothetical protein